MRSLVVMGVSGTGKSTVAALVAGRLGVPFADGDDFHPAANVAKMAAGHPLTDADRWPWLAALAAWAAANGPAVLACSALRRRYRDALGAMWFAHLDAPYPVLARRLAARHGHFMPATLLRSQCETLEPLGPGERGGTYDATADPASVAARIARDAVADPGYGYVPEGSRRGRGGADR